MSLFISVPDTRFRSRNATSVCPTSSSFTASPASLVTASAKRSSLVLVALTPLLAAKAFTKFPTSDSGRTIGSEAPFTVATTAEVVDRFTPRLTTPTSDSPAVICRNMRLPDGLMTRFRPRSRFFATETPLLLPRFLSASFNSCQTTDSGYRPVGGSIIQASSKRQPRHCDLQNKSLKIKDLPRAHFTNFRRSLQSHRTVLDVENLRDFVGHRPVEHEHSRGAVAGNVLAVENACSAAAAGVELLEQSAEFEPLFRDSLQVRDEV